MKQMVVGF